MAMWQVSRSIRRGQMIYDLPNLLGHSKKKLSCERFQERPKQIFFEGGEEYEHRKIHSGSCVCGSVS